MFAVVADSTSDIPLEKLQEMGVAIAPLDVRFGDEVYADGFEIGPEEFYEKLDAFLPELPKSACPAPGKFEAAYRAGVEAGADGVVCITLMGGASGTYNSSLVAAQACEDLRVPIRCVDSKATIAVMSMLIEKACQMRDAGASADECADQLERIVREAKMYVAMETIDNVYKCGKIAEGHEGADSGLAMKPILTTRPSDGAMVIVSKPRSAKAQLHEMANLAKRYVREHPDAEVRFCHGNGLAQVDALKKLLDAAGISYSDDAPGWICPLMGVYFANHSYALCMAPEHLL